LKVVGAGHSFSGIQLTDGTDAVPSGRVLSLDRYVGTFTYIPLPGSSDCYQYLSSFNWRYQVVIVVVVVAVVVMVVVVVCDWVWWTRCGGRGVGCRWER
jgi:hypothetical protein